MQNRGRVDPYKNLSPSGRVRSRAGRYCGLSRLVKKLMPDAAAKYRKPKDYVSEVPAASRPIEGVATSVATMPRSVPKPRTKRPSSGSAGRRTRARRATGEPSGVEASPHCAQSCLTQPTDKRNE